jgi:uncharacterized protein
MNVSIAMGVDLSLGDSADGARGRRPAAGAERARLNGRAARLPNVNPSGTMMVLAVVTLTWGKAAAAAAAGFGAGLVNAVAGGGTLISFPVLVALGVPAVSANVTNTVSLCPGYLGGAVAQRHQLAGQRRRLRSLLVVSAIGGLTGSILLVVSSEALFRALVPYLILFACTLLALQDVLRRWVTPQPGAGDGHAGERAAGPRLAVAVFAAAIYGGYFGAGLGIMLLAILGLLVDEPLNRLNLTKQALSLVINVVAAVFFAFSGLVVWSFAAVMAVASLLGGNLGGRVADRLHPKVLRVVVVLLGVAVALRFWLA